MYLWETSFLRKLVIRLKYSFYLCTKQSVTHFITMASTKHSAASCSIISKQTDQCFNTCCECLDDILKEEFPYEQAEQVDNRIRYSWSPWIWNKSDPLHKQLMEQVKRWQSEGYQCIIKEIQIQGQDCMCIEWSPSFNEWSSNIQLKYPVQGWLLLSAETIKFKNAIDSFHWNVSTISSTKINTAMIHCAQQLTCSMFWCLFVPFSVLFPKCIDTLPACLSIYIPRKQVSIHHKIHSFGSSLFQSHTLFLGKEGGAIRNQHPTFIWSRNWAQNESVTISAFPIPITFFNR